MGTSQMTFNMENDLDRYKQLLGDWEKRTQDEKSRPSPVEDRPEPIVQVKPATPRRTPLDSASGQRNASGPSPEPVRNPSDSNPPDMKYDRGTLLVLDEADLVVYRRPVAGQPLDMVYSLLADGTVKIEAVDLRKADVAELGLFSDADFRTLQNDMIWTREIVARSCYSPEDGERIPEPTGSPAPRPSAPSAPAGEYRNGQAGHQLQTPDGSMREYFKEESAGRVTEEPVAEAREDARPSRSSIRRGQRLVIQMGPRNWECVYWGRDQRGSVVAHRTQSHWTLVHLDLASYKDSMTISPEPDPELIEEINQDLARQQSAIRR